MERFFQNFRDDRFALTTLQNPNLEVRTYSELVQAAERERIRVDDPLQVGAGEVQRVLNVGQCDVHDGRVEHDHQLRGRDDHERDPEPATGRPPVGRNAGSPAADRDGCAIRLA